MRAEAREAMSQISQTVRETQDRAEAREAISQISQTVRETQEILDKATRPRYVRAWLGGGVTCFIALDKGVGPGTFRRLCNHPQQWFTDDEGDQIRGTAIVAFRVLTGNQYRKAKKRQGRI